eukprot:TRINITY_DN1460_c0_g1_i2.p1 TRINITY_DN1460_c0_g1~~TRINITY_DN1460_c0_g1_i2.p1  ORF type:complete len:136 (-),score=32.50 TRINITY_DN1460_c0_g1_i2:337-744(-)
MILMIDNAPPHSRDAIHNFKTNCDFPHTVKRYPRYSPFANPVELINALHKSQIEDLYRQGGYRERIEALPYGEKVEGRKELLIEIFHEAWQNIPPSQVSNSFHHPERYFPKFIRQEVIEGEEMNWRARESIFDFE